MNLQALARFFGFGKPSTKRVDQLIKTAEDRGAFLNMECGDYDADISARIKAQDMMRRQMKEREVKKQRADKIREIAIELVTQQVASGVTGAETWALRAAFERAKPKAEAIYNAAQEYAK